MSQIIFFKNYKNPINGGGIPIFPHDTGVAFFDNDYFAISKTDGSSGIYSEYHTEASYISLKTWVRECFGDSEPIESDYEPGTAYKRIYRPIISGSFHNAIEQRKANQSFVALKILFDKLAAIFQMIEPTESNQLSYGHLIRELLILACTEVESSWAAVLKENQYPSKAPWKTNDYVKLKEAMLLDSYQLSLRSYPDFPSFNPFEGWSISKPTKSLEWYDAYNKTKHDRELNLNCGNLKHSVHAVGAAVVMYCAQFGFQVQPHAQEQPILSIRNLLSFEFNAKEYPHACYIPKLKIRHTAFFDTEPSPDWKLVDYPF